MRKRMVFSLIILLFALASVFADTQISITLNVTASQNRYSATLKNINPNRADIVVSYSTTGQHGPYYPISRNEVVVSNVPAGTVIWFKAADDTYTSNTVSFTIGEGRNPTGDKNVSLPTSSQYGLAEEARLYYFPRNVVDNGNVMVELTEPKSISAVEARSIFNEVFVNHTDENLALFRIRENLLTETLANTEAPETIHENITITIESLDDWTFVSEYNSTRTTAFTLDAYCVEQKLTYIANPKQTYYTASDAIGLTATSTLAVSGHSATFQKVGSVYELSLPYTSFPKGSGRYYAKYIRDADICLNIPEFGTGMEPGYYTTQLRVTIPDHYEVSANQVATFGFGSSFIITIRGYLGIDAQSSGSSSFYVMSMENTYSMDLGVASNPAGGYTIAEAKFAYFDVVVGPEGVQNANILPANPQQKYTVYISSTDDYTDTSTPFRFIKIGSERQARTDDNTIYYTLTWESTNPSYDNRTTAPLYMRPTYTYRQISRASSGKTGRDSYQLNWEMDNVIKLNLTQQSLDTFAYHQEGMYYSYIYFTLVTNI